MSEIVVGLCNSVLLEKPASMPELTIEEWDEVLTFAARQGVLPILSKMLAEYEAQDSQTRKVLVRWYVKATNNQKRYQLRLKTMRQIARLFAEEGIDIMFMKGAALAQLYPDPESVRLRETIAKQNLVFRWALYILAIFAVILLGVYGSKYNAADFVYANF